MRRALEERFSALATLLYEDWLPQVNGLPRVLLSHNVNHSALFLCQHRIFVDNSNLEVIQNPFHMPSSSKVEICHQYHNDIFNIFGFVLPFTPASILHPVCQGHDSEGGDFFCTVPMVQKKYYSSLVQPIK